MVFLKGSVLGPILFVIYMNDLELNLTNPIIKFADDTKLYGKVNNEFEAMQLQRDLDLLVSWSSSLSDAV